jgi:uncharacterized membrane protein YgcG
MFFSRAPWVERIAAVVLSIAAIFALGPIVHESIKGGMMGRMVPVYSVPILSLAIVAWAVATRRASTPVRRAALVAAIVLACVPFVLIRTAGVLGAGSELHWRWTPTPEERLLAQADEVPQVQTPPAGGSRAGKGGRAGGSRAGKGGRAGGALRSGSEGPGHRSRRGCATC